MAYSPKPHAQGRKIAGIRIHGGMTQEQILALIGKGHGGLFYGSPDKEALNEPVAASEPEHESKTVKRSKAAPEPLELPSDGIDSVTAE